MYEWYQEYYVGAAHGLAGIYYYLMQVRDAQGETELTRRMCTVLAGDQTLTLSSCLSLTESHALQSSDLSRGAVARELFQV